MKSVRSPRPLQEYIWPALVLVVLLAYSYARFVLVPYLGFQHSGADGLVQELFTSQNGSPFLQVGDRITRVNNLDWPETETDESLQLVSASQPGDILELEVDSEAGTKVVNWRVEGFSAAEFTARVVNLWWISYAFWLAGTATLLLVRPRDLRRTLLAAFYFITAIWFMAGTMSARIVLSSQEVLRIGVWMSLPIYLHLHWNFPQPLRKLPALFWWVLYLVGAGGAILQVLHLLPRGFYIVPLLFAFIGSVVILVYRIAVRREERRHIGILFIAVAVALAPALAVALSSNQSSTTSISGYLLSMLALPGAYFYVVYRPQLGGLELRANRLISLYLFLILLISVALVGLPLLSASLLNSQGGIGTAMLATLVTAFVSVVGFPRFERFVEKRLLRIPEPPERMLQTFAARISTSLTTEHLVDILQKEVMPSLLIRQSALLKVEGLKPNAVPVYLQAVKNTQLPKATRQKILLDETLRLRAEGRDPVAFSQTDAWFRLAIPLTVGTEALGLWLFGRKDPDDYYSPGEQALLCSLADQTAIALANIAQAQRLRALYQQDIDRHEEERAHLARELHDEILHTMNELLIRAGEKLQSKDFDAQHQKLSDTIRRMIHGLRPPMLNFGLYHAIRELVDDMDEKPFAKARINLELAASEDRFEPKTEQHLFRIVQQACENALLHSKARKVLISGKITKTSVEFVVHDDGKGFALSGGSELAALLAAKHFGLVGMHERAELIGARLAVETAPSKGTRIDLHWRPPNGK
jgi:signal transduction histidine kinase